MDIGCGTAGSAPTGVDGTQILVDALLKCRGRLLSTRRCNETYGWLPDDYHGAAVLGVSRDLWSKHHAAALKIVWSRVATTTVSTIRDDLRGGVWFFVGEAPRGLERTASGAYDLGGYLSVGRASKRPRSSRKSSSSGCFVESDGDESSEQGASSTPGSDTESPEDASSAREGVDAPRRADGSSCADRATARLAHRANPAPAYTTCAPPPPPREGRRRRSAAGESPLHSRWRRAVLACPLGTPSGECYRGSV